MAIQPDQSKTRPSSIKSSTEGERKVISILFTDVANYTSLAEKLDPEVVRGIMNNHFKALIEIVYRYGGTVDQLLGDGMVALFGAPVSHEDHAQRACYAALSMQEATQKYAETVMKDHGLQFQIRVGINSGPVVVGSIGNDMHNEYVAIGDAVNLASRMESASAPGRILVSDNTYSLAKDFFRFEPMGQIEVKGKEKPVVAHRLIQAMQTDRRFDARIARGLTRFVGREREVDILGQALAKARNGNGQIVGIVGVAGVGKSRTLLEFKGALPQGEQGFLEGQCLHYGNSIPYVPFADALKQYFQISEDDKEDFVRTKVAEKAGTLGTRLQEALPPLEDLLSLKVADEAYLKLDPANKKSRMFEAMRDLLFAESLKQPLVLAIEDLHWMDKTSEELLTYLIGSLAGARILLILLYRPEYTHRWASKSYYTQVGLDELNKKQSLDLVQSILGGGRAGADLQELILKRVAGNPLFMEEFTHSLLDNREIRLDGQQYSLARNASDIQVPSTIQGIISARMDRLDDSTKRIMQVAAVIGREFAFRVLQSIAGMQDKLRSGLLDLQVSELIYEKALFPELQYIFKHALIQEVAYNSLLVERRNEIHGKIGAAIEQIYPDRLPEFYGMLAYHYSRSNDHEKAFKYLRLAMLRSIAFQSLVEASQFGKQALNALGRIPQTTETRRARIELSLFLAAPLGAVGQTTDAMEVVEQGIKLAEEMGDSLSEANLYGSMGFVLAGLGDTRRATEYCERASQEVEKGGDLMMLMDNMGDRFFVDSYAGRYAKIAEATPHFIDLLEKAHMEDALNTGKYYNMQLYPSGLAVYGGSLAMLGDFDRGIQLIDRAIGLLERSGHLSAAAPLAEGLNAMAFLERGDAKQAIEHAEKAIKLCEQAQVFVWAWEMQANLGRAYYLLGDLETARQCFEKRLAFYRQNPYAHMVPQAYRGLGEIALSGGDLNAAHHYVETSLELARKFGDVYAEGTAKITLGKVKNQSGSPVDATAEEDISEGIKVLHEHRLKPSEAEGYLNFGEFYAHQGRIEKAAEAMNEALRMFREMGMAYWLGKTIEALEKIEGR